MSRDGPTYEELLDSIAHAAQELPGLYLSLGKLSYRLRRIRPDTKLGIKIWETYSLLERDAWIYHSRISDALLLLRTQKKQSKT